MARDRGSNSRGRNNRRGRNNQRGRDRRGSSRHGNSRGKSRSRGGSLTPPIIAASVFFFLVVALIVGMALWPKSGESQRAACALVVDRTGSSMDPKTRSSYEARAFATIEGCRDIQSRMVVYYFDNEDAKLQPASKSQPFTLYRPLSRRESTGEKVVTAAITKARASVSAVFSRESGKGRGSDIVTAIDLASQDLNSLARRDSVEEKYLVVLTDGYQSGSAVHMKRAFTDESVDPKELLAKVEQFSLIPELRGTNVSFVGVGGGVASDKEQVPEWYEAKVEQFWSAFVTAGGGRLCAYRVEASSLPGQC